MDAIAYLELAYSMNLGGDSTSGKKVNFCLDWRFQELVKQVVHQVSRRVSLFLNTRRRPTEAHSEADSANRHATVARLRGSDDFLAFLETNQGDRRFTFQDLCFQNRDLGRLHQSPKILVAVIPSI